ncbi:MAG: hypothetical protein A2284_01015 [Deltaproteobacteria bacterium RIFOXYA12_FULL_61_11]|nr:MAG: hypothetical protein A2284_01015 [Deltaproteobacteria bacterium RIFOXYA12_FULL_61_11]
MYAWITLPFLFLAAPLLAQQAPTPQAKTMQQLTEYLGRQGQDPGSYLVSKVDRYPLVILGADLYVAQHVEFLTTQLPALVEQGLQILVLDQFSTARQKELDDYLAAAKPRPDLLTSILNSASDPTGFGYTAYVALFEKLRTLHQNTPAAMQRLRVVLADLPVDWAVAAGEKQQIEAYYRQRSAHIADFVEREAFGSPGRTLLFTSYEQALFRFGQSTANLLSGRGRAASMFTLVLNDVDRDPKSKRKTPLCEGAIDSALRLHKKTPRGFDLEKSPFGRLPRCYRLDPAFAPIKDTPWPLQHAYQGMIYLVPPAEYRCLEPAPGFFTDEQTREKVLERNRFYCAPLPSGHHE